MKKLLSFCALVVGIGTMYAERLYIAFDYAADDPLATSVMSEKEKFERIAAQPLNSSRQHYNSVIFRFVADDKAETSYALTYHQVNKLRLIEINGLTDIFRISEDDFLDLTNPKYQYLNAESFGLIMRLLEEGGEAPTFEFSKNSVKGFLRKVVAEGAASGRYIMGCKTPLTLALKLAHIFNQYPFQSRLGDMCMSLAVSDEYLKMDTPEDRIIINQLSRCEPSYINEAYNARIRRFPFWTCEKSLDLSPAWWSIYSIPLLAPRYSLLTCSPDGKHIIIAERVDNVMRVLNADTGSCELRLKGHTEIILTARYSPDEKYIVSYSCDNTVRIWDAITGKCAHILEHPAGERGIYDASYSPDGKYIVSCSYVNTVRIWDAQTGDLRQTFIMPEMPHSGFKAVCSPDGTHITTGFFNGIVRIWNVATGLCEREFERANFQVCHMAYSPDGTHIATEGSDGIVRIWNVATGSCEQTLQLMMHYSANMAYSPNGKYIVCTPDFFGNKSVWNVTTGLCEQTLQGFFVSPCQTLSNDKCVDLDNYHIRIKVVDGAFNHLTPVEQWGMLVLNAHSPFVRRMDAVLCATVCKNMRVVEQSRKIAPSCLTQNALATRLSSNIQREYNPLANFVKRKKTSVFSIVISAAKSWASYFTRSIGALVASPDVQLPTVEKRLDSLIKHGELVEANAFFEKYRPQLKAQSKRYDEFARVLKKFVCSTGAGSSGSSSSK